MRCSRCGENVERITYRSSGITHSALIDATGNVHDCENTHPLVDEPARVIDRTWPPVVHVTCPDCGHEIWGPLCACPADKMRARAAAKKTEGATR